MTASARNTKKVNIWNDITLFLRRKGWNWLSDMHLFMDGPNQRKMNLYCGKKIGGEHYILMKKCRGVGVTRPLIIRRVCVCARVYISPWLCWSVVIYDITPRLTCIIVSRRASSV